MGSLGSGIGELDSLHTGYRSAELMASMVPAEVDFGEEDAGSTGITVATESAEPCAQVAGSRFQFYFEVRGVRPDAPLIF
jgi:hypothetical protein